jgi:hypothetical protein
MDRKVLWARGMSDLRAWAQGVVSVMSRDEILDVVSVGAEGWRERLDRRRVPWLSDEDLQGLLDDVERLCRERAASFMDETPPYDEHEA